MVWEHPHSPGARTAPSGRAGRGKGYISPIIEIQQQKPIRNNNNIKQTTTKIHQRQHQLNDTNNICL